MAGGAGVLWKRTEKGECGVRDNVLVSTVAADVVTAVVDEGVNGLKRNDNSGGYNTRCKATS